MAERRSSAPRTRPITTDPFNAFETSIAWQWCRRNPLRAYILACSVFLATYSALGLALRSINGSPKSLWLVDSTSARHTTNDLNDFSTYQALTRTSPPDSAANISTSTFLDGMELYGFGAVKLEIPDWPDTSRYQLRDVLYIPSQPKKISLGILARARREYMAERLEEQLQKEDDEYEGDKKYRRIRLGSEPEDPTRPVDLQGLTLGGYVYKVNAYVKKEWSCVGCKPYPMDV